MDTDRAFEMATSNIRFGPGITAEVGMDLKDMDLRRVIVFIDPALADPALADPALADQTPMSVLLQSLESNDIAHTVFDRISVEPTDTSFADAISFAKGERYDAVVALGGGSTMDTAKAANLYTTHPADFLDYVNAPIGKGRPVPGALKPMIAIPTTAGTGSETTGVAIFDFKEMKAKTGIAHRRLKPTLAIVDPDNTKTLPPAVAASTGLDVLSHALESYTAMPFDRRPRPERPVLRPSYQGSNPISDLWSLEALRMVAEYLPRAVADPGDDEARGKMLLAAAYAGMGFGNAGVHLPHGMSYPVAGMVESYMPPGYSVDHPVVPHGTSVIVNAPAVFRFTAPACPERHLQAARILGADTTGTDPATAGEVLAECLIDYMRRLDTPNGLSALGYSSSDIPALVQGTLPQHRVTKLSPRPADEDDLTALFEDALSYW